jgi:trk system potassium uptake protein
MNILIVGAGEVGVRLAKDMSDKGHNIRIIEKNEEVCDKFEEMNNVEIICGDGCDPLVLESAGIKIADVVAGTSGDDEDNLVVAQLAKLEPSHPRVVLL